MMRQRKKIHKRQVEASTPPIVPKRTKTNQPRLRTKRLVDSKMAQPTRLTHQMIFSNNLLRRVKTSTSVIKEAHRHLMFILIHPNTGLYSILLYKVVRSFTTQIIITSIPYVTLAYNEYTKSLLVIPFISP